VGKIEKKLKMNKTYNNELNILDDYFKEIDDNGGNLTIDEEVELAIRIKNGDESAVNILVEKNLKFVVMIAHDYKNNGVDINDLVSEGNYGLIKATKRFDHTLGYRFISYAVWWVRQAMMQSLNNNARTIRLPVNILNKIYRLKKNQVIEEDDMDYITKQPTCVSYNNLMGEDGDEMSILLKGDFISDYNSMVEADTELKDALEDCLNILSEREKDIIIKYYGLFNNDMMTLECIGDIYKLSKERVRQIKGGALKKMKYNLPKIKKYIR